METNDQDLAKKVSRLKNKVSALRDDISEVHERINDYVRHSNESMVGIEGAFERRGERLDKIQTELANFVASQNEVNELVLERLKAIGTSRDLLVAENMKLTERVGALEGGKKADIAARRSALTEITGGSLDLDDEAADAIARYKIGGFRQASSNQVAFDATPYKNEAERLAKLMADKFRKAVRRVS